MFFSVIKKKKSTKNTLFIKAAMYSMMDVLLISKEGECNERCAKENRTQFD